MSNAATLAKEIEELRAAGFEVEVSELYVKRFETAIDDWDFADAPDDLLIRVQKGEKSVAVYSSGERRMAMYEILGPGSAAELAEWKNALVPEAELALYRHFGDSNEFDLLGKRLQLTVHSNGWFEEYYFENGTNLAHGEPYYDVPTPKEIAEAIATFNTEVNG